MKIGYRVLWTEQAVQELQQTIDYLEKNWTEKEIKKFVSKLDHTISLISKTPEIFPQSIEKKKMRKAVVEKYNNLYYRIHSDQIEILSLFSNRQNPRKKKI